MYMLFKVKKTQMFRYRGKSADYGLSKQMSIFFFFFGDSTKNEIEKNI